MKLDSDGSGTHSGAEKTTLTVLPAATGRAGPRSTATDRRLPLVLVVALTLLVLPAWAELEVYAPPLQSEARDAFGVDGYRYQRDGSVLTVQAYTGIDLYGTIVIQWGDGTATIDYTTLEGHPYRLYRGIDWAGYRFVDLTTGEEAEQRFIRNTDPAAKRRGRHVITAPNDAERERRRNFLLATARHSQFISWVYADTLVNLRLIQPEGPRTEIRQVHPGGAQPAVQADDKGESESEGERVDPIEKMVHLDMCPPECFGPVSSALASGISSATLCCTYARILVDTGCRNALCLDCCAYGGCSPDCDFLGNDCYCEMLGTACSPGHGGEGPPGIITFCDPGEWPPECT